MALAEDLAAAINQTLPDMVAAAVLGNGRIRIICGEDRQGWVEVEQADFIDQPEALAETVLYWLQEEMIENVVLGGWPPADPDRPDAPQRAVELPAPHAEIVDGQLHWWFGDRERPALRMPSIPLG
jgi:hypothetical protein